MQADYNLQFIRQKIYELRSAIMYTMSNDLLKIPNTIVSAIRVDDMGQLWLVCSKPSGDINQYDPSFPARLHFYRKGSMFHLEINGRASIVKEPVTGQDLLDETEGEDYLVLKMTMTSIEYTEPHEKKKGKVEMILEKGYQWIMRTVAIPHDNRSVLARMNSMKRA